MSNFKIGDNIYLDYTILKIDDKDSFSIQVKRPNSNSFWVKESDIISPNQSQLQLPEIGKEYEFSGDGKSWRRVKLKGFYDYENIIWTFIRPIPEPSPEELQFLELAEKFKNKYSIKSL